MRFSVTIRPHRRVPSRLRLYLCCGSADYLRTRVRACSIEIAYQAAEANRPDQGRAGSPLTKDPSQPEQAEAAKNPIGQASPRKRRPSRTDRNNRRVLLQVDRAEGLNVLIGCLALESHRSNSGYSRQGSSRQAMVDGANGNAAMRRAGKVHPPFTHRGYANVVVNRVREDGSLGKVRGFNDRRKHTPQGASRV